MLVLHQEGGGKAKMEKAEAASGDEVVPIANHSAEAGEHDGEGPDARTVFTGELVSCAAGEYHFTYTLQEAGNYSLSVMVGKDKLLVGGKPLIIEALPGPLSSQHCGVVGKRLGTGTLLYGSSATFSLYLRDSFGNYISCAHYRLFRPPSPLVFYVWPQCGHLTSLPRARAMLAAGRGRAKHNISRVSIYHEPGDDAPAAWSALGRLGRCHDAIYHESSSNKIDGVLDVSFTVPHRNMSGESTKELSLDLEVRFMV